MTGTPDGAAAWTVYLLRCGDGTLYCGIALDVAARLALHREGKGAKYTRGRGPLELAYWETCGSKAEALRRERALKRLPREAKLRLCGPTASR
ncbi:GIY-YIG nuclease family protein [Geothrix sp. 21YS21S-4]|uniref:GIY-YIG nuclease family protein n=1 Tax=Geothrix sp. 21YS21S-4 TaxID=3068889 RepID=UPI0027BA20AB|nr:GIY-YIG nuclease family protein [Geothrix sp. 21YS21S-4]